MAIDKTSSYQSSYFIPNSAARVKMSLQGVERKLGGSFFERHVFAPGHLIKASLYSAANIVAYPLAGVVKTGKNIIHLQIKQLIKDIGSTIRDTVKSLVFTVLSVVNAAGGVLYPPMLKALIPAKETIKKAKTEQKNDAKKWRETVQTHLNEVFPELAKTKLKLFPVPMENVEAAHKLGANIEEVVTPEAMESLKELAALVGEKPKVFSLIDFQKSFLTGGSLEVPGGEEKVLEALETFLKDNKDKLPFDLIILTKDHHPVDHKSFTGSNFTIEEKKSKTGRQGFNLIPNEQGKARGVALRGFWGELPHVKEKFDVVTNPGITMITLYPKDQSEESIAAAKKSLEDGSMMPFTCGFHPIPVTEHMFSKLNKDDGYPEPKEILEKLEQLGLLNEDKTINGACKLQGVEFSSSFNPSYRKFEKQFQKVVAQALFEKQDSKHLNLANKVLECLLEDYWPAHCVQGQEGHKFHEKLVELLEKYAPRVPVVPLAKGNSKASPVMGESYSAGFNTAGYLASAYLLVLQQLKASLNIVGGVATEYCPAGSALDSQLAGIQTEFRKAFAEGIKPEQIAAAIKQMEDNGITVS